MAELLFKEEVYGIVAPAIEVHRELGNGFAEAIYQEAMQVELATRQIPFESQKVLQVFYKGRPLEKSYVADFICFNAIIVEIKVLNQLSGKEESQVLNYLKATGLRVGLLINFGSHSKPDSQRYVR
jgi:GxxExxY protein